MPNAPCPGGTITPSIDKALRQLITTAFESGYKDIDYDRIQQSNRSFTVNSLFGITREDANRIMWDELKNIGARIQRDQELREVQNARF
ncbi:hypothetical protein [Aeromonas salmonicida]